MIFHRLLALTALVTLASARSFRYGPSNIDFGDCLELAVGQIVDLGKLQALVPSPARVLSLAQQPTVQQRPNAGNLGLLNMRVVSCDFITATLPNGRKVTDRNRRFASIGTPVNTSRLPSTPFNKDGRNEADISSYMFGYYTDSPVYLSALRRAIPATWARISFQDSPAASGMVDRKVSVSPQGLQGRAGSFGWTLSGRIPDVRKQPPVGPFIANWWSVRGTTAGVTSQKVTQAIAFPNTMDPATAVTIKPNCSPRVRDFLGANEVTADALILVGFLPETKGTDMIVTRSPIKL